MRKALDALPGVRHVYIDFSSKQVTVSVEKTEKAADDRFVTALTDAGFGGSISSDGKSKQ